MSVTGARVASIFALFGLTMAAGLGPVMVFNLWIKKRGNNQHNDGSSEPKSASAKILQLLLVFGGGVLLATCFVHMIPEIQENYSNYMETQESAESHHHHDETLNNTNTLINDTISRAVVYKHPTHEKDEHEHKHDHVPWVEICICLGLFLTYLIEESVLLMIGRDSTHHHHHQHHTHSDHQQSNIENGATGKVGIENLAVDLKEDDLRQTVYQSNGLNNHHNSHLSGHHENLCSRFLRGLIIVIAFLAHSIFDGIAIGLQTTSVSLWTMFFAICLHKLVVVFAIGFELFEKTRSLILTSIHMTIFAAMSPLGIFLCIVIEQGLSEDGSLTLILLNALATGGILYIVFLEILQADRCPEINGLVQLMALVSGFLLMTLMTVMVGHGHT